MYVPITWKQWLLPTQVAQFVYWHHSGRADPGMSAECADLPGSALLLWHQYTKCAAPVECNHCFQAIGR